MEEQEQLNQQSYYAVIPATVLWDHDLPAFVRLLYGVISSLCNEQGYCWATNRYFAERFKVTTVCVSNWISQLVKKGHIRTDEVERKDGSLQRRIFIADGTFVNQKIKGGKSYNVGGLNDGLSNEIISLRGVNDMNKHNTKSNNQSNNTINNTKKRHISIFLYSYLADDYKISSGLFSQWSKVDWNGIHEDLYEPILSFVKYRTELGKPIKTSNGMNGILNNIRGAEINDVVKLINKTIEREWIDLKFYDAEKKIEKKNKWKDGLTKIK